MQYVIMRKNLPITVADFSEDGRMLWYSKDIKNLEYAPLWEKGTNGWLVNWWSERSVPIGQDKVKKMLEHRNLVGTQEYLLKNLGLSLTDYYWIKPLGSDLTWEDVSLFQNDFQNEMRIEQVKYGEEPEQYSQYAPNSSLQGQLEKKWAIYEKRRYLIKGNRSESSEESINEVIASHCHDMQGYKNYSPYEMIKIKGAEYDFGCITPCFTNEQLELVPAYAVVTSQKKGNDSSTYEHFISICGKHGIDIEQLRQDLEYQIQMDFILSGRDRHLNNVAVLRDADTLKFLRMAPIYDSGKCLFVNQAVPYERRDLLDIETTSFASTELKLMDYVKDRTLVDVTKLPSTKLFERLYSNDTKMDERRIKQICEAYEKKIELYREFQLGMSLKRMRLKKVVVKTPEKKMECPKM